MTTIVTDRLRLRPWQDADLDPFARLNADPRVMEFFPAILDREETRSMMKTLSGKFIRDGFSFWAIELKATGHFIGFAGLNIPTYHLPFSPCVEVGWRVSSEHWGNGYAPEAARASLEFGFRKLELKEIVSFTAVKNARSRRVMEKIGMLHDPAGAFPHPRLASDHPLSRHVLYRIQSPLVAR